MAIHTNPHLAGDRMTLRVGTNYKHARRGLMCTLLEVGQGHVKYREYGTGACELPIFHSDKTEFGEAWVELTPMDNDIVQMHWHMQQVSYHTKKAEQLMSKIQDVLW